MKNVEHFGDLTPRMNDFREKVLEKKPYICAERALLVTETYKEHQNQPAVMKRALMLKNILEKMSIYIEDETLIVGNQAASNKDAPIFPEYTLEFVINELDLFEKRDGDVFYITEETKDNIDTLLKSHFRPEFLNRLDEIVIYKPLKKEEISKIVDLMLEKLKNRLEDKFLHLVISDKAKEFIIDNGYDPIFGARPLKRFIQSHVETLIARAILANNFESGTTLKVDVENDKLVVRY